MPFSDQVRSRLDADAARIIGQYPGSRSALLPLLHLVQSEEGYVSEDGIEYCAAKLGLTEADVTGVVSFYTMYKRGPVGEYHVGVCTNTVCGVLGGNQILAELHEHLGVGDDEVTPDGRVSLEHLECNAACVYAPVVMVNWEFFDNQTPASARQLADDLRAGNPVTPTRGPRRLVSWREAARILAGFNDDQATEGPTAGPADLVGLKIAQEHGWTAPEPGSGGRPSGGRASEGAAVTDILTPVLTAHWDQPDLFTIDGYRRVGGYQALPKALGMSRDEVIAIVKSSGLRGRGGAMFPTGVKWGFLPQGDDKPHYLVVNADESEPGACKDVPLMMATPHTLIEGAAIASYAIGAGHAFIYVRGEVLHVIRRLRHAVQEARAAGVPRPEHPRLRVRPGGHHPRRGRRVHLRRGDRAAGLARGQARAAAEQAAVPGRGRRVRQPDEREQRGVDRQRAGHPAERGRLVRQHGHREDQGLRDL